jgi:hypothetical protein
MNMGNMREISIQECNAVFGGNDAIVVSGRRTVPGSTNFAGTYGPVYNSSMLPAGIMGSYEDIYDPDGDDDGDGIRNMDEEIVVTADVTHDQIKTINELAAWYQWGQNVAFGLAVGGGLMTTSLTNVGQYVAGAAIGGAANVPPLSDAQYQANWNTLYYQMQVDRLRGDTPNYFNPGLNMY